jgi:polyphosphate glucokinase
MTIATHPMANNIVGVDIGGSMTKIGIVNPYTGEISSKVAIETPKNSTPEYALELIKEQIPQGCKAVGFGIPCIIKNGMTRTAPNIGPSWNNVDFKKTAENVLNVKCEVLNDADAAALAEIKFGVMRNMPGVTIFITLGTGIGTAIYNEGVLLMNTEFGRMALPGGIDNAEMIASAKVKADKRMRWKDYAENVNIYLAEINKLFWPDNVVIGGGVSDSWKDWGHLLKAPFSIHKAHLGNTAGIIGAAMAVV